MQFDVDREKAPESKSWLRCDIAGDGGATPILLASQRMIGDAVKHGHGRALYMDATHGLQRYGLKLVTVLVKDQETRGTCVILASHVIVSCVPESCQVVQQRVDLESHALLMCRPPNIVGSNTIRK